MEVTESEINISLQEALTCYLTYLSHSQNLRDARLPHQGKRIETIEDLVTQVNYQSRIAASETCLQYTDRIARRVKRWHHDSEGPYGDIEEPEDSNNVEVDMNTFCWFLDAAPEDPFLDPFSGKWIGPTNASDAGPCPRNDKIQEVVEMKVQKHQPFKRQEPCRKMSHEHLGRKSKGHRSQPSLELHPNVPISMLPSAEVEHRSSPEQSSDTPIEIILTPSSSDTDHETNTPIHKSEMETRYERRLASYDQDRILAEQLEAEESHRRRQTRRGFEEAKRLAERLAREEQARLDEQRRYVRKLKQEEREHAELVRLNKEVVEIEQAQSKIEAMKELKEPRSNGYHMIRASQDEVDQWRTKRDEERKSIYSLPSSILEKKARTARAKLDGLARQRLEDLRRVERKEASAREDEVRQNIADRSLDRKEARTNREVEAKKKVEDRKRREREDERMRMYLEHENMLQREGEQKEREKKVRFGRESRSKRLALSLYHEKRWRDAYIIQEEHKRKQELEGKNREAKLKEVECISCMESFDKKDTPVLPCNHTCYQGCISRAFRAAYKSRSPFKCCGIAISTSNINPYLDSRFVEAYNLLLLELSTQNPIYCSSASCASFIPPSYIHGPIATCRTCMTRTCVSCKKKEHSGVCQEDEEGKKVQELARKKGWKQCPNCSQILERAEGCLHMTCRCRAEWCYACLRDWNKCNSTCGRTNPPNPFVTGGMRTDADVLRTVAERNTEGAAERYMQRAMESNLQRAPRNIARRQEARELGALAVIVGGVIMNVIGS